jgi:hypothetical protein
VISVLRRAGNNAAREQGYVSIEDVVRQRRGPARGVEAILPTLPEPLPANWPLSGRASACERAFHLGIPRDAAVMYDDSPTQPTGP